MSITVIQPLKANRIVEIMQELQAERVQRERIAAYQNLPEVGRAIEQETNQFNRLWYAVEVLNERGDITNFREI